MREVITILNGVLWDSLLVYLLVLTGVFFSFRLKFLQIRNFCHMFTVLKSDSNQSQSGITPFQALMTSLAARVGTGNLAGVAIAISLGGPGAIFWMWVIAFLGMVTGYAESLLGQLYKIKDSDGQFRGGPAYYIKYGLNKPILAAVFSAFIFIGYGFVFSSTQANTIAHALEGAYQIDGKYTGGVIIVVAGVVMLGGVRAIAKFSSVLVPVMGLGYITLALAICLINLHELPTIILLIVKSAFGLQEVGSGMVGAAIIHGIKRGLYSNEAGAGTVPHAAACASSYHPATQGYVQMLGVFIDTIIVCTATAMIILTATSYVDITALTGIQLTQAAVSYHMGDWGDDYIAMAICLFSFTSIVANYVYSESNLAMFKLDHTAGRLVFSFLFLGMTFWGANASLKEVWAIADLSLGLTTLINIAVIVILSPTIVSVTNNYLSSVTKGDKLNFTVDDTVRIQGVLPGNIWVRDEK